MNIKRITSEIGLAGIEGVMRHLSNVNNEIGTSEDSLARIVLETGLNTESGNYAYERVTQITAVLSEAAVAKRGEKRATLKTGDITLTNLTAHEAPCSLLDDESFKVVSVNISTPVREMMGSSEEAHRTVASAVVKAMQGTEFPHFVVGRKNRLFFSNTPFEEIAWVKHFTQYGLLYRNELLAVAMAARGARLGDGGSIMTPEHMVSERADGVIALLTKTQGAALGLYPGCWQSRIKYPFAKGLIVVWHDDSCKPFFNTDVLKLKKKLDGKTIVEPIPASLESDKIIHIANSDEVFDIRYSHQVGYLLKNTAKSKGGAWGIVPELMANALVKTAVETGGHAQLPGYHVDPISVEEMMPDYIRYLKAAGLPHRYMLTNQQITALGEAKNDEFKARSAGRDIIDTILLAARPKIGKMYMFVCLPAEQVGMKPGWYKPVVGRDNHELYGLSDHIARVPFMAVGGGVQKIKWTGKSPLKNVIMAVVSEDLSDEVSKGIWEEIQAMGADSDGDRLIVMTNQGLKMLKGAGLQINRQPEGFKAKNPYPGLSEWTQRQLFDYWVRSTPRLANVGKGDVITRDAIDAYKSGMFDWSVFQQFASYGAGEVQVGVSAPKYYFTNPNAMLAPMKPKELIDSLQDEGIGQGRKFDGLLYGPARAKVEELLSEYINDDVQLVELAKGKYRTNWKGGFGTFHAELRAFEPELGVDWPTYVRRAFYRVMQHHGIKRSDIVNKDGKPTAAAAELVLKLIREYVFQYPHRINVWCWMLDERYTGVPKKEVLSVVGLPYEETSEE